jgi:methylmalonyl-CoA mutase
MKPDFSTLKPDFRAAVAQTSGQETPQKIWQTNEQIGVKPLYTKADLEQLEHLDYLSGIAPYLRGPYLSMYVQRPWTIRQYAGFFHRRGIQCLLSQKPGDGAKGLSIAFDLATHRGYDSDHPRVIGDVAKPAWQWIASWI